MKQFRSRQTYWIDDWVQYAGSDALADQVRFEREWTALRNYAASKGIRIIGDLPHLVDEESADVQAHPKLFDAKYVSGAPPDDHFSQTGQLWGMPCYEWPSNRADDYRWFIERFRRLLELVDMIRIDHFRGYVAYWAIPVGAQGAIEGHWRKGPGVALYRTIEQELGPLPIVTEDIGNTTPAIDELVEQVGAYSMRVLQSGYTGEARRRNHIAQVTERCFYYTGTHDFDTVASWFESLPAEPQEQIKKDLNRYKIYEPDIAWSLVQLVLASRARVAMQQMQDLLELEGDARMNRPGTSVDNWNWRLAKLPTAKLAERLRIATQATGRLAR